MFPRIGFVPPGDHLAHVEILGAHQEFHILEWTVDVGLAAEPAFFRNIYETKEGYGNSLRLAVLNLEDAGFGEIFVSALNGVGVAAGREIEGGIAVTNEMIVPGRKCGRANGLAVFVEQVNSRGHGLASGIVENCETDFTGAREGEGAKEQEAREPNFQEGVHISSFKGIEANWKLMEGGCGARIIM